MAATQFRWFRRLGDRRSPSIQAAAPSSRVAFVFEVHAVEGQISRRIVAARTVVASKHIDKSHLLLGRDGAIAFV
jgi:hypothetical protein